MCCECFKLCDQLKILLSLLTQHETVCIRLDQKAVILGKYLILVFKFMSVTCISFDIFSRELF